MEIQQLKLKNIGCFTERTFDFSDLTVIFGDNRTGKSTLVYALFFALFGKHLHTGLKPKDLCRKGEPFGTTVMYFNKNHNEDFKLHRSTAGVPKLYGKSEPEIMWSPILSDDPENLSADSSISHQVASLTSFFRESELLYFLQDMKPKHNKTLLQSLIRDDDLQSVRSKFKKALRLAKETKKTAAYAVPKQVPDLKQIKTLKQELAGVEKRLGETEAEYKKLLRNKEKGINPEVFRLLQQQYEEKTKELDTAIKSKEQNPPLEELIKKKAELEKQLSEKASLAQCKDDFYRHIVAYEQNKKDLQLRIERLMDIKKRSECPTCEQPITIEQVSDLISKLEKESVDADQNLGKVKEKFKKTEARLKEIQRLEKAFGKISRQIEDMHHLDKKIGKLKDQPAKIKEELGQYERLGNMGDAQERYRHEKKLEDEQKNLERQKERVSQNIRQSEEMLRLAGENNKNLQIAARNVLLCDVAKQAIEDAADAMTRGLLDKVRTGIRTWGENFTFLKHFDIDMTGGELLPIIQARGYQYKLNQMSKSERIFLYLMLKLALGDALGHLGAFVLDDPADGLDKKRKETLAYLLLEVAKKRQLIVTTNDPVFAEQFSQSLVVRL
ncbi:AAA family ATPase [Desulfonema magnum]|uniref:AAA ATPase domain-containing protein n=1 Tax=Desulfonema magnum TaxID=45655 RepID=A0A975BY70_9BACT|nr:AAA family ATPase [Desulfonema magnum]QTA93946.1 AAA ATPase domain-containing protein [Desulfonema magnum]